MTAEYLVEKSIMNASNTYTDGFNIRLSEGLQCPHCGAALSPHAIERHDRGGWRVICQSCHRDVLVVEPAE
jgi:transposase-like protein